MPGHAFHVIRIVVRFLAHSVVHVEHAQGYTRLLRHLHQDIQEDQRINPARYGCQYQVARL